ncbi:MAG TPA: nicotinate-nucleotide adenylyltransferase [Gemmatimonadaceae bacterium]|nr:nicotinate-nucleotide adenylyltransferase [Gemmatimonadaceae bacterium]
MRLGVLGGTFDPPHNGHLMVASEACVALQLDRVLFVPNARQPLKADGPGAGAPERLEMVRRLCQDDPRFVVDAIEIDRGGLSFTVDTLRAFHERYPGAALFLLMGDDVAATLPSWRESETVRNLAEIVVVTRTGTPATFGGEHRIATPRVDISSTDVRMRAARGLSLKGFVPDSVAEFIQARGLYRDSHERDYSAPLRAEP